MLEDEGYPVRLAADGFEAMQRARESRPSLVLLDVNLPYMNGDAVGVWLRARYGPMLPIILMTAGGQGVEKARAISAAAYFSKPFDIDELLTVVGRCVDHGEP